ncbi:protein ECT2 [Ixodes scapularis]
MLNKLCTILSVHAVIAHPSLVEQAFNTLPDLLAFEKKLDEEKAPRLVHELKQLGGKNASKATKRKLTYLLTDELAAQFSWIGRQGKLNFSMLQRSPGGKDAIEDTIKSWLRHAPQRAKGQRCKAPEEDQNEVESLGAEKENTDPEEGASSSDLGPLSSMGSSCVADGRPWRVDCRDGSPGLFRPEVRGGRPRPGGAFPCFEVDASEPASTLGLGPGATGTAPVGSGGDFNESRRSSGDVWVPADAVTGRAGPLRTTSAYPPFDKKENKFFLLLRMPLQPGPASLCSPPSGSESKRRRLRESMAQQLAQEVAHVNPFSPESPRHRRRVSAANNRSISVLDVTLSPEKGAQAADALREGQENGVPPGVDLGGMSKRQQVCWELLQTETNYVAILHTILTLFKAPLENPDGEPLLDPTEIRIIFGNLPPIYQVHRSLQLVLQSMLRSWTDSHSIGEAILHHREDFEKAYPPFVNFFEKTKETLMQCDAERPRFHAFLKRCQTKPECGRQTLVELLIRPVQRLGSVILLLKEIQKRTPKENRDSQNLDHAIAALNQVMLNINEGKRKTESQVAMFDIFNDIENCPVRRGRVGAPLNVAPYCEQYFDEHNKTLVEGDQSLKFRCSLI